MTLSRIQLARRAFDRACDKLEADRDAGLISAGDASVRYRKLYAAYQARKQDLELSAFLGSRGLKPLEWSSSLDASLSEMALDHNESRVGDTPIMVGRAA